MSIFDNDLYFKAKVNKDGQYEYVFKKNHKRVHWDDFTEKEQKELVELAQMFEHDIKDKL